MNITESKCEGVISRDISLDADLIHPPPRGGASLEDPMSRFLLKSSILPENPSKRKVRKLKKLPQQSKIATSRIPHEITELVCHILDITHALREFRTIHRDRVLVMGFLYNRHINDPRYSKMQQFYNSIEERVQRYQDQNPRIEELFNIMKTAAFHNQADAELPRIMKDDIKDILGRKELVSASHFKKFGIICFNNNDVPLPTPNNVISKYELNLMMSLRAKIRAPAAFNLFKIKGSKEFKEKTLHAFDKLLTFFQSRDLIESLYAHRVKIVFVPGEGSEMIHEHDKITIVLAHRNNCKVGISEAGKMTSVVLPSWSSLPHELIHALHSLTGNRESQSVWDRSINPKWSNTEEYVTIGNPQQVPIQSENGYLSHTMFPLRIFHSRGVDESKDIDTQIDQAIYLETDGDIERFLNGHKIKTSPQINKLLSSRACRQSPHLIKLLLNYANTQLLIDKEVIQFIRKNEKLINDPKLCESIFKTYKSQTPIL